MADTPAAARRKKPVAAVIEDDAEQALFIRLVLEGAGFEVHIASSGAQAKALIASLPSPALVTLDIELGDARGDELIVDIKNSKTWQFAPIIMITAAPKNEKTSWTVRSGAKAYLQKTTLNSERLLAAVRKVTKKGPV